MLDLGLEKSMRDLERGHHAAVERDRSDACFERAREQARLLASAGPIFSATEPRASSGTDLQRGGDARERALTHEIGAPSRQLAFARLGTALEEQRSRRRSQHRVSEELETLVVRVRAFALSLARRVLVRPAAMGQRRPQRVAPLEDVTEPTLESRERNVLVHSFFEATRGDALRQWGLESEAAVDELEDVGAGVRGHDRHELAVDVGDGLGGAARGGHRSRCVRGAQILRCSARVERFARGVHCGRCLQRDVAVVADAVDQQWRRTRCARGCRSRLCGTDRCSCGSEDGDIGALADGRETS